MVPFVAPNVLGLWLQRDVPQDSAELALDVASGAIRRFCGWSISEETVTARFTGYGRGSIFLPTLHLTNVASVVENGVTLVEGTDYDWTSTGRLFRRSWSATARGVEVTFTHGYPVDHPGLQVAEGVCLTVATRVLSDPTGVRRSWQLGDESESFAVSDARAGGSLLYGQERSELASLVLPVVA